MNKEHIADLRKEINFLKNKVGLLEEDLECIKMFLDETGVPTHDKGEVLSIVGRITVLQQKVKTGSYVLATKYSDGDPNDHWCVGFLDRIEDNRYYVVDEFNNQFRANGFRRVEKITQKEGDKILSSRGQIHCSLWSFLYEMRGLNVI